ncbi:response regulator [Intrasporangium calvum]|uniref:Transcriptional regulatory protein n=1 Tax=Intrasporangium calvum (strain ATCC 23552 / DSM 43043 / JCM 3097 / NBRC 12989 / NCIMB 10167 / NRRL B-3866 / 7 KIP) TaxID=710696 RepID=E6S8R6_INTC7|nr:response regulator [Intrasporangium calvum]ADU47035.1 response regulator receiver and unknown domain protein [Intrasporangium calvum DSM 43043]AXG12310.1 response regulator [Intrasporangium calvum]
MISVLVVDDDFMVARIHRGFVSQTEGFEVVGTASSGGEALELVGRLKPDLVLLDLYLPDIFGLDVVTRLRAAGETCDVLVITAAKEADSVRAAVRHGVVGYLLKPFSRADLEQRLMSYAAERARAVDAGELTQQEIDAAFASGAGGRPAAVSLPKGLSVETAEAVLRALREADDTMSATECAEAVGISRVSARRYLEHFVATGAAEVSLRYGATGRPERRYRPR